MAEIDKVSYCKPRPLGDWSPHEQLIDTLVKIESKRSWEDYDMELRQTEVIFEYSR